VLLSSALFTADSLPLTWNASYLFDHHLKLIKISQVSYSLFAFKAFLHYDKNHAKLVFLKSKIVFSVL